MAVNPENSIYAPTHRTAYGRIIREKGTLRFVTLAVVFGIAWYVYDTIHTNLMNQVSWPTLHSSPTGLTVLGLKDKDRPGWQHRFEARESNHSWQIRRNEEYSGPSQATKPDETPEDKDRGGSNPGATHHGNSGEVVQMDELLAECPAVLVGSQFNSASLEEKQDPFKEKPFYAIHLSLSDEGRSRYWQFSKQHDGERLVFVLNNEVITCPRMDSMYVSSLSIEPIWVKDDAQKLVDFINGQKPK